MTRTIGHREIAQKSRHLLHSQMLESIAKGVEARLVRTVIHNIVIIESMHIARKLHIPEQEILEWRSARFHRSELIQENSNLWSKEGKKDSPDLTVLTDKISAILGREHQSRSIMNMK